MAEDVEDTAAALLPPEPANAKKPPTPSPTTTTADHGHYRDPACLVGAPGAPLLLAQHALAGQLALPLLLTRH